MLLVKLFNVSLFLFHFETLETFQYLSIYTSTITALNEKFRFGHISIIQTKGGLLNKQWLANLEKTLSQQNIHTTVVHNISDEESYMPTLNIIFAEETAFMEEIKCIKYNRSTWLMFLPATQSAEHYLKEFDITSNCEFIIAQLYNESVEMTEVFRIHESLPLEFHRVGKWSFSGDLQWTITSSLQRRNNFKGLIIRAAIAIECPTTIPIFSNNTLIKVEGYFGRVWSELESIMNFRSKYICHCYWGMMLLNGSWTEMLGTLLSNKADVAISATTLTPDRRKFMDFLLPILEGRVALYIRKADSVKTRSNYTKPFDTTLWIAVVGSLLLFSLGLWGTCYLARRHCYLESVNYSLTDALHIVFASYCGQGQESTPRSCSCRIVYLLSYLVGLVLLSAYSAYLISFLAVHKDEPIYSTFEEMISDGVYNLSVPLGQEIRYFQYSSTTILRNFYESRIAPYEQSLPSYEELQKRLCTEPRFAAILSSYLVTGLERAKKLNCSITQVTQTSLPEVLSMVFNKGSPYKKQFQYNLLKMMSSGIIKRIRDSHWSIRLETPRLPELGVNLEAVLPIFIVLATGIVFSILLLTLEIYTHRSGDSCTLMLRN